ncbi:MAG: 2-hydroxyacid dehydrogenase [Solirubrobacteraceae bacterium]
MARCFVTRRLPGPALDRLKAAHDVKIWEQRLPPTPTELAREARDADGLLALLTDRVDESLLSQLPNLKAISNYAVGYDNVDLDAATRRGIPVGNTPDVLTDATADLTFALLLAAARRLPEAIHAAQEGDWVTWEPAMHLGYEVYGATLGIIGFGRIGRAVAERAGGFAMRVLTASARQGRSEPVKELLREADFVSVHCPLTPETHHLIDADALKLMGPDSILINTARGPIVDPKALKEALEQGHIAAAALDVTEPEPLPAGDPLLTAKNLIIAPHIGSATRAAREKMAALAVDNLLAALDGRPMPHQANVVAPVGAS